MEKFDRKYARNLISGISELEESLNINSVGDEIDYLHEKFFVNDSIKSLTVSLLTKFPLEENESYIEFEDIYLLVCYEYDESIDRTIPVFTEMFRNDFTANLIADQNGVKIRDYLARF